jgi:type IV pilus assembly protein PilQ
MSRRLLIIMLSTVILAVFPVLAAAADQADSAIAPNGKSGSSTIKDAVKFKGRLISLDFQDASIKNVFRVITELSGVNIVSGEDVKGNITVHMKNVPWDQALETILDTNALGMKKFGNVIAVFPVDKMKKAEEERLKEDVARGMKPQISIEAKIIEANATFARRIGVQWGVGVSSGNYWSGFTTKLMSADLVPLNRSLGIANANYAANLTSSLVAPSIGVIYKTSKAFVDLDLAALEAVGEVKTISSPKITTLDSIKAFIKQGSEIPYTVTETSGGTVTKTVTFKEAVLQLEVKPIITPDERISLEVKAKNDSPDYTTMTAKGLDNPPINKSEVSSTLVIKDGDTVIVGGIRYNNDAKGVSAVPWLYQIPVLGNLFKYQELTQESKELLIFLTPRIVREGQIAEKNRI